MHLQFCPAMCRYSCRMCFPQRCQWILWWNSCPCDRAVSLCRKLVCDFVRVQWFHWTHCLTNMSHSASVHRPAQKSDRVIADGSTWNNERMMLLQMKPQCFLCFCFFFCASVVNINNQENKGIIVAWHFYFSSWLSDFWCDDVKINVLCIVLCL